MARVAERQLPPRVSHFTKWIHLAGDRYLLMNHPRNVLMFTSSPLVEALDAGRLDDISADVRNRLLAQGYLTDLAPADEDAWITGRIDDLENYYAAAGEPKNYCFITTYRCNLSCSYCFQSNAEQRIVTNRMLSLADAEAGLQVMENETATVDPGTPSITRTALRWGAFAASPARGRRDHRSWMSTPRLLTRGHHQWVLPGEVRRPAGTLADRTSADLTGRPPRRSTTPGVYLSTARRLSTRFGATSSGHWTRAAPSACAAISTAAISTAS